MLRVVLKLVFILIIGLIFIISSIAWLYFIFSSEFKLNAKGYVVLITSFLALILGLFSLLFHTRSAQIFAKIYDVYNVKSYTRKAERVFDTSMPKAYIIGALMTIVASATATIALSINLINALQTSYNNPADEYEELAIGLFIFIALVSDYIFTTKHLKKHKYLSIDELENLGKE